MTTDVERLVSEFIATKRKYQGDAMANATVVTYQQDMPNGALIQLACGNPPKPGPARFIRSDLIEMMTEDLVRNYSR